MNSKCSRHACFMLKYQEHTGAIWKTREKTRARSVKCYFLLICSRTRAEYSIRVWNVCIETLVET